MTFELKAFEKLKKEFNRAVNLLLKEKSIKDISELNLIRKSEIQFLQTLFTEIEKEIKEKNPKSLSVYSFILYGAMLVVIKDIEMNLGTASYLVNSSLYINLRSCMGITKDHDLSPQQLTKCYTELNQYLLSVFEHNDSSQGFAENFALQSIERDKLVVFLNTSYKLEKEAYEAEAKTLTVEGTSSIAPFKMQKEINKEILTPFVSWVKVKELFDELVMKEKMDKKKDDIKALDKPRNIQLQFLTQLATYLTEAKTINGIDKTAIFTGAMYLIRGQIAKEYRCLPLYNEKLNSNVHEDLGNILHAKKECVQNIEVLLNATYQFLRHTTIELSKAKGPTIRAKHPFAAIVDFNLKELLNLNQEMICACRTSAIEQCKKDFKAAEKAIKKEEENAKPKEKSSWNPLRFLSAPKEGLKETDALDDLLDLPETTQAIPEEPATTSTTANII